jgi:hypothetical protein
LEFFVGAFRPAERFAAPADAFPVFLRVVFIGFARFIAFAPGVSLRVFLRVAFLVESSFATASSSAETRASNFFNFFVMEPPDYSCRKLLRFVFKEPLRLSSHICLR